MTPQKASSLFLGLILLVAICSALPNLRQRQRFSLLEIRDQPESNGEVYYVPHEAVVDSLKSTSFVPGIASFAVKNLNWGYF
jgi:hypothetical protein